MSGAERVSFNTHRPVRVESLGWEESSWKSKARKMGKCTICIFLFVTYMEPRKMVLMKLFAGQQWRYRHREQTFGHRVRGRKERVRCMEKVTWKLKIPYVK